VVQKICAQVDASEIRRAGFMVDSHDSVFAENQSLQPRLQLRQHFDDNVRKIVLDERRERAKIWWERQEMVVREIHFEDRPGKARRLPNMIAGSVELLQARRDLIEVEKSSDF
jgi:hypothetical protein